MNRKNVIEAITEHDYIKYGTMLTFCVSKVVKLKDGASLYLFSGEDFEESVISSAIAYNSGEVFVLEDWRFDRPTTLDEVRNYDWVDARTDATAELVDGLPRTKSDK